MKLEHKLVTIVANPDAGERCRVYLLDKYVSKLPCSASNKDFFIVVYYHILLKMKLILGL